jgi:hypothetical protein
VAPQKRLLNEAEVLAAIEAADVSISLFLGQSFHQFVTRLSSQTLA